jgi:hypothetical protein
VKLSWIATYDPSCISGNITVAQTPSTITTSLAGGGQSGASITVPSGTAVKDSATLTGQHASSATGTVTYKVYSDSSCTKSVSTGKALSVTSAGRMPTSASVTLKDAGTYYWVASYSGDAANFAAQSKCGDEVETVKPIPPPVLSGKPTLTGKTSPGSTLTCNKGTWTGNPTSYAYEWLRNGTQLAGVTGSTYVLTTLDEGTTFVCVVTASNAGGSASGTSNSLSIPVPFVPRCPKATGRMTGHRIGLARLGLRRAAVRHRYTHHATRGRRYEDFFCLTPIGVRVGYATPLLLRTLSAHMRRELRGKVVWASTSNPYYSIDGVRPGESIARASRRLHTTRPFHIGRNHWYLARRAGYTVVLKVRHGVVGEIGIAENSLTATRAQESVLMHSFY